MHSWERRRLAGMLGTLASRRHFNIKAAETAALPGFFGVLQGDGSMANTQSFDITTGCELQEVDNAVNQAMKEIRQRYDFKGLDVSVEFQRGENKLVLRAPDEFKIRAMWEVVQEKMVRRHVPLKNLQHGKALPSAGGTVTQEVNLQQGIPIETARNIIKFIKELKIKKLQSEIQGEQLRITSPSRDDLQLLMHKIKEQDFGVELTFGNFRTN